MALLPRAVGFGMGLEFREGSLALPTPGAGGSRGGADGAAASTLVVRPGMVFNVSVGVAGLTNAEAKDAKGKTYAIQVCVGGGQGRGGGVFMRPCAANGQCRSMPEL